MKLVFDIGNSRAKATVFRRDEIAGRYLCEDGGLREFADAILASHPEVEAAVISSTCPEDPGFTGYLNEKLNRVLVFGPSTLVPLKNLYRTPETLGRDRLAAAVGANLLYPERNLLVVDLGTAITFDVVTAAGEFLGGNISPGAGLRLSALNEKTGHLPLYALAEGEPEITGRSTESAIQSGVAAGIIYEIEGYIDRLSKKYDNLCIIFTGGDADFFAKRLKNPIFANYDLVAIGLNRILEYNAY